jgi:steroid delta-isomerase-like uncharacterized protein
MTTWIEGYFEAWSGRDVEKVVAYMTEDVEFEDVGAGHRSHGKDEVRRFVEACHRRVPDATYSVVQSRADTDTYWVEWVMHARGVDVRGASVGLLRDAKIAFNHDYWSAKSFTP